MPLTGLLEYSAEGVNPWFQVGTDAGGHDEEEGIEEEAEDRTQLVEKFGTKTTEKLQGIKEARQRQRHRSPQSRRNRYGVRLLRSWTPHFLQEG